MPSPAKQFSPSELAALEHAFAADPGSDAYRPLTEAYLAMGRFMEAMVVCKKGVKVHPEDVSAKALLARVYADQGKDRKALEELQAALTVHPQNPLLNRMAGQLYMKLGQKDLGVEALKRAADAAPGDPEVNELLRKHGVAYAPSAPKAAPPKAPPPPAARPAARTESAPVVARSGSAPPPVVRSSAKPPPAAPPLPKTAAPVAQPSGGEDLDDTDVDVSFEDSGRVRALKAERNTALSEALAERYGTQEYSISQPLGQAARKRSRGTFVTTIVLAIVFGGALVAYYGWSARAKTRAIEIDRLIKQSRELIEKDTYKSYSEAAKLCEQILSMDSDSVAGHAYLAYVDTLLSGEHGAGEGKRDEAKSHLELARKLTQKHSHIIAAEAYLHYYAGDTKLAIDQLNEVLSGEAGRTSALLNGALGIILMQTGDLDGARASLTAAQKMADRDARINQMLGELFRRRGPGYENQASVHYNEALKNAPEHVPSLLGYAMILLSLDRPDEAFKIAAKVETSDPSPRQLAVAEVVKASVLYSKNKTTEGAAEEQKALGRDPSNPDIYDLIGRRKLRQNDGPGAVIAFQEAIKLDPRREMFYVLLSQALAKQGGAKPVVDALAAAARKLPEDPRIAKLLGDAQRNAGSMEDARKSYETAISLAKPKAEGAEDRGYPEAHLALGELFVKVNDVNQAVLELDRAVQQFTKATSYSTASDVSVTIAELELKRNQGEAAYGRYKLALDSNPRNCVALWAFGKMSIDRKLMDEAKKKLALYVQECPKEANIAEATKLVAGIR